MCIQRVEAGVVFGYVLREVILSRDDPRLGFQLLQEGFLFAYTVKVKENLRTCIPVPEPIG
jgi:hypothetical protein